MPSKTEQTQKSALHEHTALKYKQPTWRWIPSAQFSVLTRFALRMLVVIDEISSVFSFISAACSNVSTKSLGSNPVVDTLFYFHSVVYFPLVHSKSLWLFVAGEKMIRSPTLTFLTHSLSPSYLGDGQRENEFVTGDQSMKFLPN